MKFRTCLLAFSIAIGSFLVGCDSSVNGPQTSDEGTVTAKKGHAKAAATPDGGPFTFDGGPVFDIDAAPNGNILVPVTELGGVAEGPTTIWEIRTQGQSSTREVSEFSTPDVTPVNGISATGAGSFFAARGGLDEAEHAAVLHVSRGQAKPVADIETFESAEDPDKFAISTEGGADSWKDPACAPASGPFTPGPQSNPYHLDQTSPNTTIVGDAAGNTVLRTTRDGDVEVVALFTPATDENGDFLEFPFPSAKDGDCYVQPVPNAVSVGPNGDIYAGELTGVDFTESTLTPLGVSRIWRIDEGATNAVCPSDACEVALDGFTAIVDIEFAPDGDLFVVEYDENGFGAAVGLADPAGGTVSRCDLEKDDTASDCEVVDIPGVEEPVMFPAAVTFDDSGNGWLLNNNLSEPAVRRLN